MEGTKQGIIGCESGGKTVFMCSYAVEEAAKGSQVIIIDEETPKASVEKWLNRFSLGLDYKNYEELPIELLSRVGFRFGRENTTILDFIRNVKPKIVNLDSFAAMVAGGRQGDSENDLNMGVKVRDNLNRILEIVPDAVINLALHTKKGVAEFSLDDIRKAELVSLVRGHGSIVGEGCDIGFVIKKISGNPNKIEKLVVVPKSRRFAEEGETWLRLEEEAFNKGWARLVEIEAEVPPPSELELALYHELLRESKNQRQIRGMLALYSPKEIRNSLTNLIGKGLVYKTEGLIYNATTSSLVEAAEVVWKYERLIP